MHFAGGSCAERRSLAQKLTSAIMWELATVVTFGLILGICYGACPTSPASSSLFLARLRLLDSLHADALNSQVIVLNM
jgi:hypothetical protein